MLFLLTDCALVEELLCCAVNFPVIKLESIEDTLEIIAKEQEKGNDGHGSKIIVIPFDGAALDKDLQGTK